jgi:hypothetical protein
VILLLSASLLYAILHNSDLGVPSSICPGRLRHQVEILCLSMPVLIYRLLSKRLFVKSLSLDVASMLLASQLLTPAASSAAS